MNNSTLLVLALAACALTGGAADQQLASYSIDALSGMFLSFNTSSGWFVLVLRDVAPFWTAKDPKSGQLSLLSMVPNATCSTQLSGSLSLTSGPGATPLDANSLILTLTTIHTVTYDVQRSRLRLEVWPGDLVGDRTDTNLASLRAWVADGAQGKYQSPPPPPKANGTAPRNTNSGVGRRSLLQSNHTVVQRVVDGASGAVAAPAPTTLVMFLNTSGACVLTVTAPKGFDQALDQAGATYSWVFQRPGTMADGDGVELHGGLKFLPAVAPLLAGLLSTGLKAIGTKVAKYLFLDPIVDWMFPKDKPDPLETWKAVKGYVEEYVARVVNELMFQRLDEKMAGLANVAKRFAAHKEWNNQKSGEFQGLVTQMTFISPMMLEYIAAQPGPLLSYVVPFGDTYLQALTMIVTNYTLIYKDVESPDTHATNLKGLRDNIREYKKGVDDAFKLTVSKRSDALPGQGTVTYYEDGCTKPRTGFGLPCGWVSWTDATTGSFLKLWFYEYDEDEQKEHPEYIPLTKDHRVNLINSWANMARSVGMTTYISKLGVLTGSANLWLAYDPTTNYNVDSHSVIASEPMGLYGYKSEWVSAARQAWDKTTPGPESKNFQARLLRMQIWQGPVGPNGAYTGPVTIRAAWDVDGRGDQWQVGPTLPTKTPFVFMFLDPDEYIWAVEGLTGGMDWGTVYIKFTTNKGNVLEAGKMVYMEGCDYNTSLACRVNVPPRDMTVDYGLLTKFKFDFSESQGGGVHLCGMRGLDSVPGFGGSMTLGFTWCYAAPVLRPSFGTTVEQPSLAP